MARYRHYDPDQTKMIPVSYGRQLLPGTFEHALSYLIDNEIDLGPPSPLIPIHRGNERVVSFPMRECIYRV